MTLHSPRPTASDASDTHDTRPAFLPYQEVRYALVLYGGVSLAIYINGVVQEFLRLVRATAPDAPSSRHPDRVLLSNDQTPGFKALEGSERVYRKLGQYLRSNKPLSEIIPTDPVQTRFVIDVLSGSSAGGINAVFLGKALASEAPMDQLQNLWMEEADLKLLINDRVSASKRMSRKLRVQDPPRSLLNGERMYLKLVDAFERMRPEFEGNESRLVDELDVFVTATDYSGLVLPIQLSDEIVKERRHKNVFHLKYASEYARGNSLNDFVENDSFLAFCTRCTSAFPFAFEPFSLADTDKLQPGGRPPDRSEWAKYFDEYAITEDMNVTELRSFTDGGVLDNKPFSYAVQALSRRRYDFPGTRKLIYIEPSPELLNNETAPAERKPNALENALASLSGLPRYETIREDLQWILNRNAQIRRLAHISTSIEKDIRIAYGNNRPQTRSAEAWVQLKLSDLIQERSPAYAAYYRMKVAAVTDDIAELVTLLSGWRKESDEYAAVRSIVEVWRDSNYSEEGNQKATLNQFLLTFDFSYRLRRLIFTRQRADDLFFPERFGEFLKAVEPDFLTAESNLLYQQEMLKLKGLLAEIYTKLRKAIQDIRLDSEGVLSSILRNTNISSSNLMTILKLRTEEEVENYIKDLLIQPENSEYLELFLWNLDQILQASYHDASEAVSDLFDENPESKSYQYLHHFYAYFEDYDMILFPVNYTSGFEEFEEIDVVRISPNNTDALFSEDERRRKLAGTSFGNFGGFLERLWRENDILWGRLDGAERIIQSVLPKESKECIELVEEAQTAILKEYLTTDRRANICAMLAEAMALLDPDEPNERLLMDTISSMPGSPVNQRLKALLLANLDEAQWKQFFATDYQVNRRLNREEMSRIAARSTTVTGKILEDVSENYGSGKRYTSWVTMAGRLLWGFVEVSIPQSVGRLFWHHLRALLLLFEALLLLTSFALRLIGESEAASNLFWAGVLLIAITISVNTAVFFMNQWMRRKSKAKLLVRVLLVFVVIALVVLAFLEAYLHGLNDLDRLNMYFQRIMAL